MGNGREKNPAFTGVDSPAIAQNETPEARHFRAAHTFRAHCPAIAPNPPGNFTAATKEKNGTKVRGGTRRCMRCLHDEALGICEYAGSHGLVVTRCDVENKSSPTAVEASAIGDMLKRSEILWGAALPYYLCISETFEAKAPSLKEAVMQVEASSDGKKFLIVAYQDGGLISVSGAMLPFQIDARTAEWWGPYRLGQTIERMNIIRTLLFGLLGAIVVAMGVAIASWVVEALPLPGVYWVWTCVAGFFAGVVANLVCEFLGRYKRD